MWKLFNLLACKCCSHFDVTLESCAFSFPRLDQTLGLNAYLGFRCDELGCWFYLYWSFSSFRFSLVSCESVTSCCLASHTTLSLCCYLAHEITEPTWAGLMEESNELFVQWEEEMNQGWYLSWIWHFDYSVCVFNLTVCWFIISIPRLNWILQLRAFIGSLGYVNACIISISLGFIWH